MVSFDKEKLRDKDYKNRFYAKLEEIGRIRRKHTFIAYATNRELFSELSLLYKENLEKYEAYYAANKAAYEHERERARDRHLALHAVHRGDLQKLYKQIDAILEPEDYQLNSTASAYIEELRETINLYLDEFKRWEDKLQYFKEALKDLRTSIWDEDYQKMLADYQLASQQIYGPELLSIDLIPTPETVQALKDDRAEKIEKLKHNVRFNQRMLSKLSEFEDKPLQLEEYLALVEEGKRLIRFRRLKLGAIGLAVAGVLITLGVLSPTWYQSYHENKLWEEVRQADTYQAYQKYLMAYPFGRYTPLAQQGIMELDSGSVGNLISKQQIPFTYEGDLLRGEPNGQGQAIYSNGDIYKGAWEHGYRSGEGTFVNAKGDRYEGGWRHDIQHGHGTQIWSNGDEYEGDWTEGMRDGEGTLKRADGSKYVGGWKINQLDGNGTFSYNDKSKYIGRWKSGKRNGNGTYYFADGSVYEGNWLNDARHGYGKMKWKDGRQYTGGWANNRREGKGRMSWPEGGSFEGYWRDNQINGQGTFTSMMREDFMGRWETQGNTVILYANSGEVLRKGVLKNGLFIEK